MSQPVRQDRTRPIPERMTTFPVITRHTNRNRQIGQVTYLIWRCEMFMKDRQAAKAEVREYMNSVRKVWVRGDYEATCRQIETIMKRFLQSEADQLQAIFDDR